LLMTRNDVLDFAREAVCVRGLSYDGAEDSFTRIARLWSAHFQNKGEPVTVTPQDVAQMMILLKVARLEQSPNHADSWVDIAGYAACGGSM
jgi:hypothetical protein